MIHLQRMSSALVMGAVFHLLVSSPVQGQAVLDPVLIENSVVQIRKSDYELELERLPAEVRPGFANSERRVNDLLRKMLLERTLAVQARSEKLDQVPANAAKLAAETARTAHVV